MSRYANNMKQFNNWVEFELHFAKICNDPTEVIQTGKMKKGEFYWRLLEHQRNNPYWNIVDYHHNVRPTYDESKLEECRQLVCEYWDNKKVAGVIRNENGIEIWGPIDLRS